MLRYQFEAIFILIKKMQYLEFYLSTTRRSDKIRVSILKLPKVHQSSSMVVVWQHLHGSNLNAKASVDIVTPLALTVMENK